MLLEAAAPVLKVPAAQPGYTRVAAFGSVARQKARPVSDIDLIVEVPTLRRRSTSSASNNDVRDEAVLL